MCLSYRAFMLVCTVSVMELCCVASLEAGESVTKKNVSITVGIENAAIVGSDNRALQAGVDYVAGLGGGTVHIGPGVYLMKDSFHLRSNVAVIGQGKTTILRKCDGVKSALATDGDCGQEEITLADPDGFEVCMGVHIRQKELGGFYTTVATIISQKGNVFGAFRGHNSSI